MSEQGTSRKTKTSDNPPARRTPRSPARASKPEGTSPVAVLSHEEIAARAYGHFLTRGGQHGDDWEDWFRAEADVLREMDQDGGSVKESPGRSGRLLSGAEGLEGSHGHDPARGE
jgi:hypothetical protein